MDRTGIGYWIADEYHRSLLYLAWRSPGSATPASTYSWHACDHLQRRPPAVERLGHLETLQEVRDQASSAAVLSLSERRTSSMMSDGTSSTEMSDRVDRTVPRIIVACARETHHQLTLDQARKPIGQGGWRPNAGRPRGRTTPPHDARPVHVARNPVHVPLRLRAGVPSIARTWLRQTIRDAIKDSQRSSSGSWSSIFSPAATPSPPRRSSRHASSRR
ncbi:hypothetical protein BH11MYX1_BH11MYX1_47710 [soil metagenome]